MVIHSVEVPKDLSKVKTKFIFGLTGRQLICFAIAAGIGIPIFILLHGVLGSTLAIAVMMVAMMPLFFIGMYEKDGQPCEKLLKNWIRANIIRPKYRPFKTDNYYSTLLRAYEAKKEVNDIVRAQKKSES